MPSNMIPCEFARNDTCEVSTLLVGLPVAIDEKACQACKANRNPMAINPVTCSRAAWAARKANLPIPPEALDCVREGQKEGPGTELKKILSRFAMPTSGCGCDSLANLMNLWGPAGCAENMELIVSQLRDKAHQRFPATKYLPIDWRIRQLVRRAIKCAQYAVR